MIHRHESLRSRFLMADGTPVQQVAEASCRPVDRADCAEPELGDRLTTLAAEPLDPAHGPLRPTLLRLADDDWVLAVLLHHLVIDDWSLSLLDREFSQYYQARRRPDSRPKAQPAAFAPPLVQLGTYADAQRQTPLNEDDLRHWTERLTGAPDRCTIPPDRARPAELGTDGARIAFRLDDDVTNAVR